jgi:hypothetical protein
MTPSTMPAQLPLFPVVPAARPVMNNPLFLTEDGQLVYHVRKNDDEPESPLMHYWFSFSPDNSKPVDVRRLPGYNEPEYEPQANAVESSQYWLKQLATEAARVIRLALQNGCFAQSTE